MNRFFLLLLFWKTDKQNKSMTDNTSPYFLASMTITMTFHLTYLYCIDTCICWGSINICIWLNMEIGVQRNNLDWDDLAVLMSSPLSRKYKPCTEERHNAQKSFYLHHTSNVAMKKHNLYSKNLLYFWDTICGYILYSQWLRIKYFSLQEHVFKRSKWPNCIVVRQLETPFDSVISFHFFFIFIVHNVM